MPICSFASRQLSEASTVLNRSWSRHEIAVTRQSAFHLRFSTRSLSRDMSVSRIAYGADVLIHPRQRDEVLLFKIPLHGRLVASFPSGNVDIETGDCALIDVRNVTSVQCAADLDALVVRVRMSRLQSYLQAARGRRAWREFALPPVIARGSEAWARLQPIIALVRGLSTESASLPDEILASYEQAIVATLMMSEPRWSEESGCATGTIAPRHVRRAEAYVLAHLDKPFGVRELSHHAGVSVRALYDGFTAFRGMAPAAFVREARLVRARRDLEAGAGSVAEIGRRYGFSHAGNFAARYRERFGEAPGTTHRFSLVET